MKPLLIRLIASAFLFAPVSATATEFCDALSHVDELPKKYAKRGPFHADAESGWIIPSDQLRAEFSVTDETRALWQALHNEFAVRDVRLVALIAPPRPLYAPQGAVPSDFDTLKTSQAFSGFIAGLNAAGITAPDLSETAESGLRTEYYFARDTHWTPLGAAWSAAQLAESLGHKPADEILAEVNFDQNYSEKGSLSAVVEATCGARPAPEITRSPTYSQAGDANSLLGDAPPASVALVGTSFSDRYKSDSYQVASALAHAFEAEVDNFSVTGGGMVGAMEAFIQSGALETGQYKTVVWEAPYTAPLTNIDGLRQILGAFANKGRAKIVLSGQINKDWQQIKTKFLTQEVSKILIETPKENTGKLSIELFDTSNNKHRIKLVKSNRVSAGRRSSTWSASLVALPLKQVVRFKIKFDGAATEVRVSLTD